MNQGGDPEIARLLDDFRPGAGLDYNRRLSSVYSARPLPLILTPQTTKRPSDDALMGINSENKRKKSDSLLDDSLNNSMGSSPWELTHLRSQLGQARAEIKTLESRISQLHGLKMETEQLCQQEKAALKLTIDQDRNTIQQLERRVTILKRREEKLKDDLAAIVDKMNSDQRDKESKSLALFDENLELKHEVGQLKDEIRNKEQEIRSLQVDIRKLESDLDLANNKYDTVNQELCKLRQSLVEFEKTKGALAEAQLTVQELESARKSFEEMELMVKSQQAKLMRYSELERKLKHLMQQNSKLKEGCSNSLHLEALVEEMKQRLTTLELREKEIKELRVSLGLAEARLTEYKCVASQVLGESSGALQLGDYIKDLHHKSLLSASQQAQLANKIKSMEETEKMTLTEVARLKKDVEKLKEEISTTDSSLRRLKKQNALLTGERNVLRSLIDSCQKEVTMVGLQLGAESRVETLEKMVEGYRKMMGQMEADPPTHISPGVSPSTSASPPTTGGAVDREMAESLDKLKEENRLLKDKLEKLEFEMEHRALKGDFNTLNTKILHFKMNPTTEALNSREDELERLRKELFEKNERLALYSKGNLADVTQIIAERQDIAKEVEELREKVKSGETVNQRLKEAFKTKGQEFREAIYRSLGYKVDGLPNSLYRLTNLYAEHPDQYLMFKMTTTGMELLETDYSKSLNDLVEEVLIRHRSIPVFLSSLTLDLFKRQSTTSLSSSTFATTSVLG